MPLDVQTGELADRLRNFFKLTGRIPAQIDEVTVPTAVIQNLDRSPYRSKVRGASLFVQKAAVAANLSVAGFRIPPPRAAGAFTLREMIIVNRNAMLAEFEYGLLSGDPTSFGSYASAGFFPDDDNLNFSSVPAQLRTGVEGFTFSTTPSPLNVRSGFVTVPAQSTLVLPDLSYTIRSGFSTNGAASPGFAVITDAVLTVVGVSFIGEWDPEATQPRIV